MNFKTKQTLNALCLLSLSACVTTPGTRGHSLIVTSVSQENGMGKQAFEEIKQKEKISRDPRLNAMLQRVGKRIAGVAPVSFEWEFILVESKDMNAFCLPGGKVAFYTGILPVLENEGAMAIVMGHEVAHAVARHAGQRMTQTMGVQLGLAAIDATVLRDNQYRQLALAGLGLGANVGLLLPFSRDHESEADSLGIRYAAQAGYDPAEGPRFWQRFSKATSAGGKPPQFLSTHPADSTRIRNLEKLQAEAQALYQASGKYGTGEKI